MVTKVFFKLTFFMLLSCWGAPLRSQNIFDISLESKKELTATAYVASMNSIAFFGSSKLFFYSLSEPQSQPEWLTVAGLDNITAAVDYGDDELMVFDGSSYIILQPSTGDLLTEWQQWNGLPNEWRNNLTSAVKWNDTSMLLFYNGAYVVYDFEQQAYTNEGTVTSWRGWPEHWQNNMDATLSYNDGYIYFFNDGETLPYSLEEQSFIAPLPMVSQTSGGSPYSKLPPISNAGNVAPLQINEVTSNAVSENNICLTGNPAGLGYNDLQSQLHGKGDGSYIEVGLEPGFKVSAVKVYSSKIWGKTIICGLETILTDNNGNIGPKSVFGKTSSTVNTVMLGPDECFAGISGSVGGDTGNFINMIQIITSSKTSPAVGNKFARGAENFSSTLESGSIFNGFYGKVNQNITAIGLKYFGLSQERNKEAVQVDTIDNTNPTKQYSANTGSGVNTSKRAIQLAKGIPPTMIDEGGSDESIGNETDYEEEFELIDAYIDDYEDYTYSLADATEWVAQPLSGIDWLGSGFDILYYDPLRPNELNNRKSAKAVVITNSAQRAGNQNQYLKPFGSHFGSANSGVVIDSSTWVSSYQQFTNSFSIGVSPSVEIPKLGKASFSPSYKEMNSTSLGSSSIYMFNKVKRKIHEVELQLDWIDNTTGQKYKQKLDRAFKQEIAALPVPSGSVKDVQITKKNQPLPSELGVLKGKYYMLIRKYGTHIAQKVSYGGQYISRTQVKRSDYERSRMTEADFKYEAEAQIKAVKVGNKVDFSISDGETSKRGNKAFRRDVFVQGGDGNTDLDQWRGLVSKSLAPVEMYFIPLSDLLNEKMFDDDADIDKKNKVLSLMIQKYIYDEYIEPVQGKNDFFRALPDLPMPGNIMVKNGGGYVMWFSVKYEHKGAWVTKESGNFSLGKTESIEVPIGAKNITIVAEQTTGEIFTETLTKPENKCFKCWGTIFKTGYGQCDE